MNLIDRKYLNKEVIVYLNDDTRDYGKVELIVDEGEDTPKDRYILLKNGKGYYFDEIVSIKLKLKKGDRVLYVGNDYVTYEKGNVYEVVGYEKDLDLYGIMSELDEAYCVSDEFMIKVNKDVYNNKTDDGNQLVSHEDFPKAIKRKYLDLYLEWKQNRQKL